MQKNQEQKRYLTFNNHLQEIFGEKVHKVTIDAGFTCPNRDGTRGTGGCIYCYGKRVTQHIVVPSSIKDQIRQGKEAIKTRYNTRKFLAYFQSYTNTYAPAEVLMPLYRAALEEEDIVGLAIGTRPDCVDEAVLDVLEALAQETYLWVEYGLQSMHDTTLNLINRGHGLSEFLDAVLRTKKRKGIKLCVHVILGLPGESKEEMLETAKMLSALHVNGVKIHSAHVLKGTRLEEMYLQGEYQVLELPEYVEIVCDFLEYLSPEIVIHRLIGDAPRSRYVAPEWCLHKSEALRQIDLELERRNSFQGIQLRQDKAIIIFAPVGEKINEYL